MSIETINPATGKLIKRYETMSEKVVTGIISSTHQAYLAWQDTPFLERKKQMLGVSELLKQNKDEFARIITSEMGKPILQARAEIEKCASVCEFYANHAEALLKDRHIKTEMKQSKVIYRPLGIVFAIMPWNFPFWQVFRFAAPNLMAGNGALLSHAPICTGTSLCIENLFNTAGFPKIYFVAWSLTMMWLG